MTRAAIYARISHDELGLGEGVQRQIEDTRALAASRGWEVVREFVDNDISAFSGKHRPAYQALMAAIEAREVDTVIVYMSSRLWRSRGERSAAIDRLGRLRVRVAAVRGPELDLSSAGGRMVAGVLGEFDTHESEVKGERLQRAALQRAQQGKAHGRVPYGWRRIYETHATGKIIGAHDEVDPSEAAIIQEVARRLLNGEPAMTIAADLNDREVPIPSRKPGRWTHITIRWLMLRPGNVGDRVHLGHVIGPAIAPAILERDTYDRITSMYSDPRRRNVRDGSRRHLLSYGIGECGVCGGELRVATIYRPAGQTFDVYKCRERACVGRAVAPVDQLVGMVVTQWFASQPNATAAFYGDDEAANAAHERVTALRARLDTAADQYASGDIDASQLARISARLRTAIEAAEAELRAASPGVVPEGLDDLLGDDALEAWHRLGVVQQRAILAAIGLHVVILPVRRGRGFRPEGVRFDWKR